MTKYVHKIIILKDLFKFTNAACLKCIDMFKYFVNHSKYGRENTNLASTTSILYNAFLCTWKASCNYDNSVIIR